MKLSVVNHLLPAETLGIDPITHTTVRGGEGFVVKNVSDISLGAPMLFYFTSFHIFHSLLS